MKYRDLITEHFENGTFEELLSYGQTLPDLEQIDLLREIKHFFVDLNAARGAGSIPEADCVLELLEEKIENFQDKILDEKLAQQQYIMANEQLNEVRARIEKNLEATRQYVIECITAKAENAGAMRELADKLIGFEKKTNIYDPENWKAIL